MAQVCFNLPTKEQVTFKLTVEQDMDSVRGNAMASGDDELDKKVEDEILERLGNYDAWAWASVCITASYKGQKGTAYLGHCCYDDEKDFLENSGYYEQMCEEAYEELLTELQALSD